MIRFTDMKICLRLFVFAIYFSLMAACSKGGSAGNHDDDTHTASPIDITSPVLDIVTPTPDQVFASGSTINVTGRITDDLGLYRGRVRITDDANGALLKEQTYEIHFQLSYNFNVSYTPTVSVPSNYTVTVFFEDHGYNTATKTVKIKVNP